MNKVQIESIKSFRSDLFEDVDKCNELKRSYDFDLKFPQLMIITVKLKIVNDFLDIFNLIIKKRCRLEGADKLHCMDVMKRITKRVKIHIAQLKKFSSRVELFETCEIYYKKLLKAVYRCILT